MWESTERGGIAERGGGGGTGLQHPDPLVREAYLLSYDYIGYVTGLQPNSRRPPSPAAAALRHAGDDLQLKFPIFFRRWPRVFQGVTTETACPMLLQLLDEHFQPADAGASTRRRELAWSAVLSVYVLAGQMALHCQERGMLGVLPELQERVGQYMEAVICPQIRDKGGWSGFVSRYSRKQDLEGQVRRVCCWTLLFLASSILSYFLWKRQRT
ncbi:BCL2 like 16 [Amia ocellicauda]|uniref:BCL2 like 16 n=1 Tax=Amia ocellicauda TaxID=2972642 RepID=UPI003464C752